MHALVMCMIVVVTTFEYLASKGWIHPLLRFLPEGLSLLVAAYVIVAGMRNGFRYVRPVYWLVFGALLVTLLCGLVINMVSAGTTIAGLRTYLRALPLFFLPAVFAFSNEQIRAQLTLLLLVCLAQAPIAFSQRVASWDRGYGSGDLTIGTLMSSGILSVFMICAVCVLTGLYMRKRISGPLYLGLFCIFLFPTMINETKATLFLLPLGLITVFALGSKSGRRAVNLLKLCAAFAIFLPLFVTLYDAYQPEYRSGILEFFSDREQVDKYIGIGLEVGDRPGEKGPGRLDALGAAVSFSMEDPFRAVFGVGIGNATPSALGPQFEGVHYGLIGAFLTSLFGIIVVELGFLGLGLVLICKWLIFRDCLSVAKHDGEVSGAIALGWAGVVAVFILALPYTNASWSPALSYLFWYVSGIVAARRVQLAFVERRPLKRGHALERESHDLSSGSDGAISQN